ncbi:MAG: ATP cone domain-containing protein [Patescibacteria group bacterium]|jgi:hypothetical protein
MRVTKSDGKQVVYNQEKIRRTLKRAGAKSNLIRQVLENVNRQMRDGMTTRELYAIVRRELRHLDRRVATRYNLRNALLRLGPAGFKFEQYVAAILAAYQYEVETPVEELSGLCVNHEIDVIAKKDGRTAMIEAKFRNRFDETVSLKDTMATWAAFVDMTDGARSGKCVKFDECWIVTNGRFSERALMFGVCRGMHLVGWGGEEHSLARLVDHAELYPITVIDDLRQWELDNFTAANLILCHEVAGREPEKLAKLVKLPTDRVRKIIAACAEVISVI